MAHEILLNITAPQKYYSETPIHVLHSFIDGLKMQF